MIRNPSVSFSVRWVCRILMVARVLSRMLLSEIDFCKVSATQIANEAIVAKLLACTIGHLEGAPCQIVNSTDSCCAWGSHLLFARRIGLTKMPMWRDITEPTARSVYTSINRVHSNRCVR